MPDRVPPPIAESGAGRARPGQPPAALVVGAVVLALSGLVAAASRGAPEWTSLGIGPANRSDVLANVAVVIGFGGIAAVAFALVVHHTLIDNRAGTLPLRTTLQRVLPFASVALALLALLAITRTDLALRSGETSGDGAGEFGELTGEDRPFGTITDSRAGLPPGEDRRPESDGEELVDPSTLDPRLLILFGVLLATVVSAMIWSSYARRSAAAEHPGEDDDAGADPDLQAIRGAVHDTIESMLADPDPNTAIIGAYARLLEGLADCDVERLEHEAPLEHLRRTLTILRVRPEPLRQLIGLFEVARFSTHPLTLSHREQALSALRAAATDLAAYSPLSPETAGAQPIGAWR